jgi:hypothetical protein
MCLTAEFDDEDKATFNGYLLHGAVASLYKTGNNEA